MKEISFRNDVLPLKDRLFRLAYSLTFSREESEDIVQETLIKVWNKRDELGQVKSLEAYCYTVCKNLAIDSQRKKATDEVSLDETVLDVPTEEKTNPDEQLIKNEGESLIESIVRKLPDKQREIVMLREVDGKEYKEIASILGLTESDVKVSLFRARQKIKEQFNNLHKYGL